jgi:tryptophan synthase alpha chain
MSSRIPACFAELRQAGRSALIPFVTAGDPRSDVTVPLMLALVQAGADIIELGVPFSDPMADGPVIQRASERALKHHLSLRQVLGMVRQFRAENMRTPVVLMGYLNPIEVMGYHEFAEQAAAAGVDGVLTVDFPPEEGHDLLPKLRRVGVDPIFLIAPTTAEARIRTICAAATGFVYYVSVKGVTGANHLDLVGLKDKLSRIRAATQLPVGVGFGIKNAESAAQVALLADAVIVGSAVVKRLEELAEQPEAIPSQVGVFVRELRQAMDAARAAA